MTKIAAILNTQSGSVPATGAAELSLVLAEFGYAAEIFDFSEGDFRALVDRAIGQSPDYLIAWGGDGSINCAFSASGPSGPPVLALPGGTMNMIHQRLHRDQAGWQDILRSALSEPEPVGWAAGEADGHRFFVAVMAGRITQLSESRELVRKGALIEAVGAAAQNNVFDMETRLAIHSQLAGQTVLTEATAAAIILAGDRRPRFDVAAIDPNSPFDLMSVGLQSLFKGWRDAEDVTVEPATRVSLADLHGEPIPATLDGEPIALPAACEIRLIPDAVRVLRAKPAV